MSASLPDWVKVDVSFKENYGNKSDTVWHVRGIVDGCAVCRRWRKIKNRWQYEVLDPIWFEILKDRLLIR